MRPPAGPERENELPGPIHVGEAEQVQRRAREAAEAEQRPAAVVVDQASDRHREQQHAGELQAADQANLPGGGVERGGIQRQEHLGHAVARAREQAEHHEAEEITLGERRRRCHHANRGERPVDRRARPLCRTGGCCRAGALQATLPSRSRAMATASSPRLPLPAAPAEHAQHTPAAGAAKATSVIKDTRLSKRTLEGGLG